MYFRRVPPLVYLQPLLGEIIDDEGTEVRAATVPRGSRSVIAAQRIKKLNLCHLSSDGSEKIPRL